MTDCRYFAKGKSVGAGGGGGSLVGLRNDGDLTLATFRVGQLAARTILRRVWWVWAQQGRPELWIPTTAGSTGTRARICGEPAPRQEAGEGGGERGDGGRCDGSNSGGGVVELCGARTWWRTR